MGRDGALRINPVYGRPKLAYRARRIAGLHKRVQVANSNGQFDRLIQAANSSGQFKRPVQAAPPARPRLKFCFINTFVLPKHYVGDERE